ncbi:hypothetical protein ACFPH6_46170 [Streptomyces xiangluensis]|uniref:Uncharacterized protein n=1 Tax=Streptomyces xiangluensis TaxID=2665720 RepID=A0ABV8Z8Y3_9ACTN
MSSDCEGETTCRPRWFGGRGKAGRGDQRSAAPAAPLGGSGADAIGPEPDELLLAEEYGALVLLRSARDTWIS